MNCIVEDRYGRLLFTDGFDHLANKDIKKLKVFTDYGEASKAAEKVGGYATSWDSHIEKQGTKRKEERERQQKYRKELLKTARVIDIPTRRKWKQTEDSMLFDIMLFDWFVPIKTLIDENGYPIAVIGETPALESIHCYAFEELEAAQDAYEVVQ